MQLAILMYHSIDDTASPVSVSATMLATHLEALQAARYSVLPLGKALDRLGGEPESDERVAALTFDDGYASVHRIALPLLSELGWQATVFPVVGYLGGNNQWPGQASFVPAARLLAWEQLRELSGAGWEIGAHTRTHPDLTTLADRELESEVVGAKAELEGSLGRAVSSFAYPYGRYDRRVRELVRHHYSAACTTDLGLASSTSRTDALERLEMWYFSRAGLDRLFTSRSMRPYLALRRAARSGRALLARHTHQGR